MNTAIRRIVEHIYMVSSFLWILFDIIIILFILSLFIKTIINIYWGYFASKTLIQSNNSMEISTLYWWLNDFSKIISSKRPEWDANPCLFIFQVLNLDPFNALRVGCIQWSLVLICISSLDDFNLHSRWMISLFQPLSNPGLIWLSFSACIYYS